jgi:molybdopterin converting factor small subunit
VEVTVRLFAMLRDRAGGAQELVLELPEGARVRDALESDALAELADGIPLVMAVNREYADGERVLDAGDELALIPPVSGGGRFAPEGVP